MKTRRVISTISYNTKYYLIDRLDNLINRKIISYYQLITHQREEDEKKDHIHLMVVPNGQLDTMDLQQEFLEILPGEEKPRGCIDFHASDKDEWLLYCEHFRPYLLSKGIDRKHLYSVNDFISSDELTFDYYYHHAHYESEWARRNQILAQLQDRKVNPADLIKSGVVPLNLATQVNALMHLESTYPKTERGEKNNHENNQFVDNDEFKNLKEIVEKLINKVYNN